MKLRRKCKAQPPSALSTPSAIASGLEPVPATSPSTARRHKTFFPKSSKNFQREDTNVKRGTRSGKSSKASRLQKRLVTYRKDISRLRAAYAKRKHSTPD